MKRFTLLLIVVALVFGGIVGCDSAPSEDAAPVEESASVEEIEEVEEPAEEVSELVERAQEIAALAKRIEESPESVDDLLSEAGLTEDQLEEVLFEISEDPDASKAYADAR